MHDNVMGSQPRHDMRLHFKEPKSIRTIKVLESQSTPNRTE